MMQQKHNMIPSFKILRHKDRSQFFFLLNQKAFVKCWSKGDESVGFAFALADFNKQALDKAIESVAQELACPPKELHFKIVGPGKILSHVKDYFSSSASLETVIKDFPLEVVFEPKSGRIRVAQFMQTAPAPAKTFSPSQPLKILVVDDSSTIRSLLRGIFSKDKSLEVIADSGHPREVMGLIEKHKPDLITLDIHMPEMNGVDLLKSYIKKYPIPTVMISSISVEEGPLVFSALENGAVDYIKKPVLEEIAEVSGLIIEKVKTAAQVNVGVKHQQKVIAPPKKTYSSGGLDAGRLIAIGSSTGGTEALRHILTALPNEIPPVVIVQHIPAVFSKAFADRVNEMCKFEVKEAQDGDQVLPNRVLIAPGGKQMRLKKTGDMMKIVVDDSPPVNRHKPSVDVLFDSIVDQKIPDVLGIILTGMGADGARGMKNLKEHGAITIAQDEASSVVWGMPAAAIKLGCVDHICALDDVAGQIVQLTGKKAAA